MSMMDERTMRLSNTPAFPCDDQLFHGMTLRDYFAAQALQGMTGNSFVAEAYARVDLPSEEICNQYAIEAYRFADAMLMARA